MKSSILRMLEIVLLICGTSIVSFGQGRGTSAAEQSFPKVSRVLLISVDGLHALDLANFVKAYPDSTMARLSSQGVTYTQALTNIPSESFPGLLGIVTGGSSISTGVYYEGNYSRDLSPPGSNCATRGTPIFWDGTPTRNKKVLDSGGIDPAKLPLDPDKGCTPVYPHNFLRTNTIFEVARAAGIRTRHGSTNILPTRCLMGRQAGPGRFLRAGNRRHSRHS